MDTEYFEAIIQLRNAKPYVIEFMRKEIKTKKKVFIAKEKKVANGIDFYMNSQHFAQNLGKRLQQEFGGELKISRRLFSRSRLTSRTIYRVSVCYIAPDFKVGDVVKIDDKIIEIRNLGKGSIAGINLCSDKKINLLTKKKEIEVLEKMTAIVSKTYPHLEVIHPKTYQSVEIKNQRKTASKEIEVVVCGDTLFMV